MLFRSSPDAWTCLVPVGGEPALLAGSTLSLLHPYPDRHVQLPYPGFDVLPLPAPETGVVVMLAAGCAACWWRDGRWQVVRFAEEWGRPLAACTRDGLLVGTDGTSFRAWHCSAGTVRIACAWRRHPGTSPIIALVPGAGLDDLVALHRDGTVELITVPAPAAR